MSREAALLGTPADRFIPSHDEESGIAGHALETRKALMARVRASGWIVAVAQLALTGAVDAQESDRLVSHAGSAVSPVRIERLLRPDGTLDLWSGYRGSVSPEGWRITTGPSGASRLEPRGGGGLSVEQPAGPQRAAAVPEDENWDGRFSPSGTDGDVHALAFDGAGNVYVGGSFIAAGGVISNNVARWDGLHWSSLGSGLDNTVLSLAIDDGGVLYAGGFFGTAGGASAPYIARWDGVSWSAVGSGMDGPVGSLALNGNGDLYASGYFTTAGGVTVNNIAGWDGANWFALGSGVDDGVYTIELDASGDLYAGGDFTTAGGVSASRIARWDGTDWSALGSGMSDTVFDLAFDGNGDLYAGGYFATAGGVTVDNIARWDGTSWSALGSGLASSVVYSVALDGSGNLCAGGSFLMSGHIARWDGSIWSVIGSGVSNLSAIAPSVRAMKVDAGGKLHVGGHFDQAGTVEVHNIATWDEDKWLRFGGAGMSDSAGSNTRNVYALDYSPSGDLYAAGDFKTAGGVSANRAARWDGAGWTPLGSGMNSYIAALATDASGKVYAGGSFTVAGGMGANRIACWNGVSWSPLDSGMEATVDALAMDAGGNLYAGGAFTTAGGVTVNHIAIWDGVGWATLGAGMDGRVRSLAFDGSGNLYAGGDFTTADGVSASHIARWDGVAWSSLGSGTDGAVVSLAIDESGVLYAGGYFGTAGGVAAQDIARWDGANWSALGSGMDNGVKAVAVGGGGTVYAGGFFTSAGGVNTNFVARWDGASWSALGSGTNWYVDALAVDGSGNLAVGGEFTAAGDYPSLYIAMWHPVITCQGVLAVPLDYATIQEAIDAACPGDTVLVADGTYAGAGNKNLDFGGKSLVLMSENGAAATTIDCQGSGRGFEFHSGEGSASIVEGFTVTNASAAGGAGAGLIITGGSAPTVRGCVFNGCTADSGAGAYAQGGTFTECAFVGNVAGEDGGGIFIDSATAPVVVDSCDFSGNTANGHGGGVYFTGSSLVAIHRSSFGANRAGGKGGGICADRGSGEVLTTIVQGDSSAAGGAICVDDTSSVAFTDCLFDGNGSSANGGGLFIARDGAASFTRCSFTNNRAVGDGGAAFGHSSNFTVGFDDCDLQENIAGSRGGALACFSGSMSMVGSRVRGNLAARGGALWLQENVAPKRVEDCVLTGNAATIRGGAIFLNWVTVTYDTLEVIGSTIASNSAALDGGGLYINGAKQAYVRFERTILWGDCASTPDPEIALVGAAGLSFACSDVDSSGVTDVAAYSVDNLFTDPLFCGAASCAGAPSAFGDYRLLSSSQCLPSSSPCGLRIGAEDACGPPTGIADRSTTRPVTRLHQNVPNPFSPGTRIRYEIPSPGRTGLAVYDVSGRLVRTLVSDWEGVGNHSIAWDGRDDDGRQVPNGVYFYRLATAGEVLTRRMLLLK